MNPPVYGFDRAHAARIAGSVERAERETRENYNVTPLDAFAYRSGDNTGVAVEITGTRGTSGPGNGLHAALLRFTDTAASPPTWNDGEVVWYMAPADTQPKVGTAFANARLAGVASDGRPVFTAGECCNWSADYGVFNSSPSWVAIGGTNTLGFTGPAFGTGVPGGTSGNNLVCRTYLTWKAPPYTAAGGTSGLEVTVPAGESHFVDASISVQITTNTMTYNSGLFGSSGDWNSATLGANTHRCQLVYAEARLFGDLDGLLTDVSGVGNPASPWLPVVYGQVVYTLAGMVPIGNRVPSYGAGFDMLGFFRGSDNAPDWRGTNRTLHYKNHTYWPQARRYGWVVNVWYDATWPTMAVGIGAQFLSRKVCCEGTAPAVPTVLIPPPPIPPGKQWPPEEDPPKKEPKRNRNVDQLILDDAAGSSGPSITPGGKA